MKPIEFFRDSNGSPMAKGSDAQLATFLMTDCQSAVGVIDDLLQRLEADEPSGEFTGNAHHVVIESKRVSLEPLHPESLDGDTSRFLSTAYFRETVRQWRDFVTGEDGSEQDTQ